MFLNFHDQIKKLNLEVALFTKLLNSHIENVKVIDDDTVKSMIEMQTIVTRLLKESTFCKTQTPNEYEFIGSLNDEYFEYDRYIFCRLCDVSGILYSMFSKKIACTNSCVKRNNI